MSESPSPASRNDQGVAETADASATSRGYPSEDLIRHTIRVWEPRLGRALTEEDARQILENVVGFFRVLHDWDREARGARSEAGNAEHDDASSNDPRAEIPVALREKKLETVVKTWFENRPRRGL